MLLGHKCTGQPTKGRCHQSCHGCNCVHSRSTAVDGSAAFTIPYSSPRTNACFLRSKNKKSGTTQRLVTTVLTRLDSEIQSAIWKKENQHCTNVSNQPIGFCVGSSNEAISSDTMSSRIVIRPPPHFETRREWRNGTGLRSAVPGGPSRPSLSSMNEKMFADRRAPIPSDLHERTGHIGSF